MTNNRLMPSAAPNAFRSQNVASAPNPGAADLGRFMCSPHRKHRLNQRSNVPALHDHDIVVRWVEGLGQSRHVRCREEGPGRPLKYNGDAWRSIDDGPKPMAQSPSFTMARSRASESTSASQPSPKSAPMAWPAPIRSGSGPSGSCFALSCDFSQSSAQVFTASWSASPAMSTRG